MSKAPVSRPSVFEHHDPVEFLQAWTRYLGEESGLSLRALSTRAGLAAGFLPMVLARKRTLSVKAWLKLAPHLKLNKSERDYLSLLRDIADSPTQEARLDALAKLQRHPAYRRKNPREVEVHRYLTQWSIVAIRELANTKGFRGDPQWIVSRLRGRVSFEEVKRGLAFLKEAGYLAPGADGRLRATRKDLVCRDGVYKISLGEFHRQTLALAIDSIANVPADRRSIEAHTLPIRSADLDRVRAILNEALDKIAALEPPAESGDSVYHVSMAAFPLTKQDADTKGDTSS